MRFMYQYPETIGPDADMMAAGPVTEIARTVEAAGWDGFAFTEHPVPGARWLAPTLGLAAPHDELRHLS